MKKESEVSPDVIGQRIRRARTRAGLSIREVAERAEISKNTILRVEQGLGSHDSTLKLICRTIGVSYAEITGPNFSEPTVVTVHHKGDDRWYDMEKFLFTEDNVVLTDEQRRDPKVIPFTHLRSILDQEGFRPHLVEINHPTQPRSHRGTEFVLVLKGAVQVVFDEATYELQEEESICFWAAERHSYEPLGDGPNRILSVVFDPFPELVLERHDTGVRSRRREE